MNSSLSSPSVLSNHKQLGAYSYTITIAERDIGLIKKIVYESIKNQIITKELEPGQVLNEKELIATYSIGRTPLREVLVNLQQDGLINIIARYGTFVTGLDIKDFRDVVEVRMYNEILVADLVCERMNVKQLAELETIIEESEALIDSIKDIQDDIDDETRKRLLKDFWVIEERFHNLLYVATANPYLMEVMKRLSITSIRFWYYTIDRVEQMKSQFHDFRDIYNSIKTKDKQRCRDLMKRHIELLVLQIKDRF